MKIGFIGGDLRQLTLMDCFKKNGHAVKIYGYDGAENSVENSGELADCEILVFPVPTCSGDGIFAPKSNCNIHINDLEFGNARLIFYAGGNEQFNKKLASSGALCINYLKDESLVQKNAIATAEGTLEILINETAETVFGSNILVTGYGKVAKAVCKMLSALGASVTVAARRKEALAEAYCDRMNTLNISELSDVAEEFNVIINTVPALVIDNSVLLNVDENALVVDLASKPGGVDFIAAKDLNRRVIWSLGIPGKVAPVTSGKIIYETLNSIIMEKEVYGSASQE